MNDNLTYGQKMVNAKFNPSESSVVDCIKGKAADLIDELESTIEPNERSAKAADIAHAIRLIRTACMFGVAAQFIEK